MTEERIAETLDHVVPHREVPAGLLGGARRRRRRTRNLAGAAALVLVAGVAVPLGLSVGGFGSGADQAADAPAMHEAEEDGGSESGVAPMVLSWEDTAGTSQAATASSRIAWDIMVADEDVRSTNKAIAPSSLAVTLAMLGEGATGASATSLDEAFGLAGDDRSAAVGALRQALFGYEDLPSSVDADDPPESPVVHQGNRVVVLDEFPIEQTYLDRLVSYYGTGVDSLPKKDAKADLDAWARENTAGLIEGSAIEIKDETILVSQDALLFAAGWEQEFTRDDMPLPFTDSDGNTAIIDALNDTFSAPYATGDGWEAVRLPYDDALAMDIILPTQGVHPSELDFVAMDASVAALDDAPEESVNLTVPPSDIETKWDLLDPLAEQGVDLQELNDIYETAFTDQLKQQVRLTVTAKGTVGAAVTEAAVSWESGSTVADVDMTVDRPFIMRVIDTRTGWPLFVAIVNDPSQVPE